jgi:Ca2+-binding EF-hand superfamily protein
LVTSGARGGRGADVRPVLMAGGGGQTLDEYLDSLRKRFDAARRDHRDRYLKQTFEAIDTDGSGEVSPDEFRQLCKKLDPTLSAEAVEDALEIIDEDGDGDITLEEFKVWWESDHAIELREAHDAALGVEELDEVDLVERWEAKRRELASAALRRVFQGVDADGSGEIEFDEFRSLCRRLDARIEAPAVEAAWEVIDEDGSGAVDFGEFERWWGSEHGLLLRGDAARAEAPSFTYKELLEAVARRKEERQRWQAVRRLSRPKSAVHAADDWLACPYVATVLVTQLRRHHTAAADPGEARGAARQARGGAGGAQAAAGGETPGRGGGRARGHDGAAGAVVAPGGRAAGGAGGRAGREGSGLGSAARKAGRRPSGGGGWRQGCEGAGRRGVGGVPAGGGGGGEGGRRGGETHAHGIWQPRGGSATAE